MLEWADIYTPDAASAAEEREKVVLRKHIGSKYVFKAKLFFNIIFAAF